jgi:predicted P-loop ATPase
MKIGADIQQVIEACSGKWLIEIPELDGMGKKDAASIKAMLSRQIDEARLAYGRYRTRSPRQFVMFGSVNDTHFLQDTTGNRRFWPVLVKPEGTAEAVVARLVSNRDQLWAEAAHYERQGESVILPEHLWAVAAKAQKSRMVIDPWMDRLEDYLSGKTGFIPTTEIYGVLGVGTDKQSAASQKRVAGILAELGYERTRPEIETKRVWGYKSAGDVVPPE